METNNQDWIDNINKKLEEQREAYKDSIESGETFIRHQSYAAKCADGKGGKVFAELYGGKYFTDWQKENPEEFKESSAQGGFTQGKINKEQGLGLFSQTKEEWSENASKNAKSFWENADEETIKNRNKKAGDSIKKTIAEKKQNGTWSRKKADISSELQKQMASNMVATKLNKRDQRIKDLYNAINTDEWFTLEYAITILSSYSENGASEATTRRMIHGTDESKKYFEFRKTSRSKDNRPYMEWRKIVN